jgi:hypothetical protein
MIGGHISESQKWATSKKKKLRTNVLDNSETTHRLKRYTVLTLPHRHEQNPNASIKMIPKLKKKQVYELCHWA